MDVVEIFIKDVELSVVVKKYMEKDCYLFNEYFLVVKCFNLEINLRVKDRVVSFGEKLSCRFMIYLFKDRVSFVEG